jgi:uncharacterized cupin superfamily protein
MLPLVLKGRMSAAAREGERSSGRRALQIVWEHDSNNDTFLDLGEIWAPSDSRWHIQITRDEFLDFLFRRSCELI